MSTHAAGFDPAIAAVLEHEALASGELVEQYIQRAVAARIVADLSRRNDPTLEAFNTRLAEIGLEVSDLVVDTRADEVVTNPARLRAVARTGLLDAPPDPAFDRIVHMAAEALGAPSASLSLMDRDRLFILSSVGLPADLAESRELPLSSSITRSAVAAGHTLVVEDASIDAQLKYLPFVRARAVVGYLGIPLIDPDGYAIGSLAVWDSKPRHWSTGHVETLHSFARLAGQRVFGTA
ncbi:MAG: GAF domain-containing protein [Mycobacterium sp.]